MGGTAADESGPGDGEPGQGDPCAPRRFPLLTQAQYANTVADLLNVARESVPAFSTDPKGTLGFAAGASIETLSAERLLSAAESLAATATDPLTTLVECAVVDEVEEDCAQRFVADFGRRAFRRPLTEAELTEFMALFAEVRDRFDAQLGIQAVVEAMLVSPHLLYIGDLRPEAISRAEPSAYTVASRLSYFMWASPPDRELLDAADQLQLGTSAEIEAQARRMATDPRVMRAIHQFVREWLSLETLATIPTADLDPTITEDMERSLRAFVEHAVATRTFEALLRDDTVFANAALGPVFGMTVDGDALGPLEEPAPGGRMGLLGQPAFLTVNGRGVKSDPTHRGLFIRSHLLCSPIPDPPADVTPELPDIDGTTREIHEAVVGDPACGGCHRFMDPMGFGMEHFDGLGRYRELDGSRPVDASGSIEGTVDADGSFDGLPGLMALLAGSSTVRECFVEHVTSFASPAVEADRCADPGVRSAFVDGDGDLVELMVQIATSDRFLGWGR